MAEINQIVSAFDISLPIGIRDPAVILLGYAAAMRPGEVSALDAGDIVRKLNGILVTIRRSKTDQEGRGQTVGIARGDNPLTAPIRTLDE